MEGGTCPLAVCIVGFDYILPVDVPILYHSLKTFFTFIAIIFRMNLFMHNVKNALVNNDNAITLW